MTRAFLGYALLIFWTAFFLWLFPHVYYQDANGIFAGNRIVWADWAVHTTYATRFARYPMSEWFKVHPLFIGAPFNYPFLSALLPGLLLRKGLNYEWAMDSTAMVLCTALFVLLFFLYRRSLGSPLRAGLALTLGLTGGGLGFLGWFQDLAASPHVLNEIVYPPREYGTLQSLPVDYGNLITNLLLPQRALQMGLVIGLVALWLLLDERAHGKRSTVRQIVAGVALGLLPVTHAHSFVAVSVAAALILLSERRRLKDYLPFIAVAGVLSTAMLAIFHSKSISQNFMGFQPGWLSYRNERPGFFVFWFLNWSFFPILAVVGLVKTRQRANTLAWAGLALFLLANVIRFQPWDWDNTKIFAWSYFLLAPAAIEVMGGLWRNRKWWGRALVVVMAFTMTASGWLELVRLYHTERNTFGMYSADELALARDLSARLKPSDRVLVVDDHHDWVSAIAGGQILMGYDGWLGSWGFSPYKVQQDLGQIFRGGPPAIELMQKYGITYAVLSMRDLTKYGTNNAFFARYPLIADSAPAFTASHHSNVR